MTERQMWLTIAEAFDQYAQGAPETKLTACGLCRAVGVIHGNPEGAYNSVAHKKLDRLMNIWMASQWGEYSRYNARFRATVAGFLAAGMDP
jgi:hypothetical protein